MLDMVITKGLEPVRWLVIAGIAYTGATSILTLFATPQSNPVQPLKTQGETAPLTPTNINWVLSNHLFGNAGAAPLGASRVDEPAVATRLPLELQSVFVADVAQDSAAIIAQRGKPGLLYKIGVNVPGNAKLVEVRHDKVFLRRAGIRETLTFPKSKLAVQAIEEDANSAGRQSQTNRPTSSQGQTPPRQRQHNTTQEPSPEQLLDQYQDKLANDAAGTLNELGLEAAQDGGYRLGSNAQSPYLKQTGLQPGDRIMSVNGRPVGDVQQDRLELANVLAQGSARIEVMRGSRRFFVTVSLQDIGQGIGQGIGQRTEQGLEN